LSLDQKTQILEVVASNPCGVRDLVYRLSWRTSKVISLLKTMNQEGIIELQVARYSSRGRPKKIIKCTRLGLEFFESYRILKAKLLRARKQDIERAVKDALYTKRLVESGHSPFKLFMELNTIVYNIKVSSQTYETIRK